jgi:hypothetical protein
MEGGSGTAAPAGARRSQARVYLGCLVAVVLAVLAVMVFYVVLMVAGSPDEGVVAEPATVEAPR